MPAIACTNLPQQGSLSAAPVHKSREVVRTWNIELGHPKSPWTKTQGPQDLSYAHCPTMWNVWKDYFISKFNVVPKLQILPKIWNDSHINIIQQPLKQTKIVSEMDRKNTTWATYCTSDMLSLRDAIWNALFKRPQITHANTFLYKEIRKFCQLMLTKRGLFYYVPINVNQSHYTRSHHNGKNCYNSIMLPGLFATERYKRPRKKPISIDRPKWYSTNMMP